MKYAFQHITLQAPSLYTLINTWAEMHLSVTDEEAVIRGYGYAHEIAEAFSTLVLDWEASIRLDKEALDPAPGEYDLIMLEDTLYACRAQRKYAVADRAVWVNVDTVNGE